MFKKIHKYINSKIHKWKFKKSIKKEKRKIFIDDFSEGEKKFKKRKKIVINFPSLEEIFKQDNLKKFYIGLFSISIISIIILLFSPIFNISKIEIESDTDSQDLININIAYSSIENFRNKNLFFINQKNVGEQLINYQKNINKIEINKKFFEKKLVIKLYSYEAIFYTILNGNKYLITKNGVLVKINNKNNPKLKELIIITNNNYNNLYDYKKLLKEEYLIKILKLEKDIQENIVGLKIEKMYYFEKERELHFIINNNIKLIFDINTKSFEEQIKKIAILHKEHLNLVKSENTNYIDLRIPNKIYYCTNDTKSICDKNIYSLYDIYKNNILK